MNEISTRSRGSRILRRRMLLAAACLAASTASAQTGLPHGETPDHPPHPIQDNSFLIEEAYNQEEGVVQHISQFVRSTRTGDWVYSFTQEWPVPRIVHQLSYTVLLQSVSDGGGRTTGPGDLALNYRYQLVGNDDARTAVAPRLTLFLPSGSDRKGLGAGSVGVQVGVPLSLVLSERWTSHWNVGGTYTPSARNAQGAKANAGACNLGQSFIWEASPTLDLMLETVWSRAQSVIGPGRTVWATTLLVSPGVRWAYDLSGDLQIVPGIGIPIGLGPSRGQRSVLLYLSFERPFRKPSEPVPQSR